LLLLVLILVVFVVNIYSCVSRRQHFGLVNNAYIRLVDKSSKQELAKYNLSEGGKDKTALILGEVYRHNGEWKFNAVGTPTKDRTYKDAINTIKARFL
jgi:stress response protein SCP2